MLSYSGMYLDIQLCKFLGLGFLFEMMNSYLGRCLSDILARFISFQFLFVIPRSYLGKDPDISRQLGN